MICTEQIPNRRQRSFSILHESGQRQCSSLHSFSFLSAHGRDFNRDEPTMIYSTAARLQRSPLLLSFPSSTAAGDIGRFSSSSSPAAAVQLIIIIFNNSRSAHHHHLQQQQAAPSAGVIKQDWEPVVMHKAKPKSQDLRDPKAVNHALRSGAPVQTIKKFDAGSNKKATAPVVNARKLEEETEPAALGRISTEVRQAIQKARLEKKMSQTVLAKLINEQPKVVQEYENGKAVPNQAILAKMERVLGVKLRGKTGK